MFGKKYEVSLNLVHDSIVVREGGDTLELHVDADPGHMVAGLRRAHDAMKAVTAETPEEEIGKIALDFAAAIFGTEQANALMEFYHGAANCVISVCGKYFSERLGGMIAKAQKKRTK